MKMRLYSVLDRTAQQFGAPMSFVNDDVARRSFADAFTDPESVFSYHPEDFELHFIGEFDATDRSFVSEYLPEPVMAGLVAAEWAKKIVREAVAEPSTQA